MKIPKKFKVFASTINVGFDNARLSNEGLLGSCSFMDNKISICDEYKGEKISECSTVDTFYHEKIHIILDAMGEHELSQNEKFVEVFARLLRQSDESAEF
jgi:hypothetical protein